MYYIIVYNLLTLTSEAFMSTGSMHYLISLQLPEGNVRLMTSQNSYSSATRAYDAGMRFIKTRMYPVPGLYVTAYDPYTKERINHHVTE